MTSLDSLDRLKKAIEEKKLVIVCGAGVSAAATKGKAPTWEGLIRKGIEHIVAKGKGNAKWKVAQDAQMDTNDLTSWLQVADQITQKLGAGFEAWLGSVIGTLKCEDDSLLKAIAALNSPVATLNYDSLLQRSTGRQPITWQDANAIARALDDPAHGIIHLHGYWEKPDTCVFGATSYARATAAAKTQFLQQAMALSRAMVFIGCGSAGFSDPNLGLLNDWLDANWAGLGREHYWLFRNGETAEGLPDHIVPIPYGADYADMPGFVAGLAPAAPIRIITSAPTETRKTVYIEHLPETPYVKLVGRQGELQRLDDAWDDPRINIISAIAEGGTGKTSLVNEWLVRMRDRDYGAADAVLGWSFYNQGSKERATSADDFLTWAVGKLGLEPVAKTSTAKAEAIADALASRRVLLVVDGVEPLQHGAGLELGKLKDQGLRTLLRRYAAMPPGPSRGLIVATSRAAIEDVGKWETSSAPVIRLDRLSDEAGAALLKDNDIRGTERDLKDAVTSFGGHALSLSLLAGYLRETQNCDVRRRDRIRALLDPQNPGQDHARRVMESYAEEWLATEPVLDAAMSSIGLFNRPADESALDALRREPVIEGLTEPLVGLGPEGWNRAVTRLRKARLLLPSDPAAPDTLDAHPLVREWFGERLTKNAPDAYTAAHGRLYEHLRDSTEEGAAPTLDDLAPLYQAIAHGCQAGRHKEALTDVYQKRVCRLDSDGEIQFYTIAKLGAYATDLAAITWFFKAPFEEVVSTLSKMDQSWVFSTAAFTLRAQGRFTEALPADRVALMMDERAQDWINAAITAGNISEAELLIGETKAAAESARRAVGFAERAQSAYQAIVQRSTLAHASHCAGDIGGAEALFVDAEMQQARLQPHYPLLYSLRGYQYCDLMLGQHRFEAARDRATQMLMWTALRGSRLDAALSTLALARAHLGVALQAQGNPEKDVRLDVRSAFGHLTESVDGLRKAGAIDYVPRGLLARAAFFRSVGAWDMAALDLDEIKEISEPGPLRIFLCDAALERARAALAHAEGFAPISGFTDNSSPRSALPDSLEAGRLRDAARVELAVSRKLIEECGYNRRNEEFAELETVLGGTRRFADLPPRV